MKKHVLLILIASATTSAYSQFANPQWSEIRQAPQGFELLLLTEDASSVSYALHGDSDKKPDRFLLEIFNEDMGFNDSVSFSLPGSGEKKPHYMGAHSFTSGFYVFATNTNTQGSGFKHSLLAYKIGANGIEDTQELANINFETGTPNGDFKLAFSASGDYYCVLTEHPHQEGVNELITVSVFDQSHKQVFSKELPLDVIYKKNIHNYLFCTNSGGAYIVKKDKEKNVFRYLAYSIQSETTSLVGKAIAVPTKHITDIRAHVTENGHLHIGGFTHNEPIHEYTGYFLFGIDAALNTTFRTSGNFDAYTLEMMLGKKASKDPVMRGFYIDRIIALSDGTTYLLTEQQSHGKEDHGYGNALILVFDKEGKYRKSHIIKKSQNNNSPGTDFGSYTVWSKKDTMYIAFNDATADLINKSSKILDKSFLKTHVVTISYDNGVNDTEWIEKFDQAESTPMAFEPDFIWMNKNNRLLFRFASPDQKSYRLVKMDLN